MFQDERLLVDTAPVVRPVHQHHLQRKTMGSNGILQGDPPTDMVLANLAIECHLPSGKSSQSWKILEHHQNCIGKLTFFNDHVAGKK